MELKGPGILTMDGFYAIAGCTSPTVFGDRGCGPSKTYVHINVEVWTGVYLAAWDELHKNYPATAPKNLGNSAKPQIFSGFDLEVRNCGLVRLR